MLELVDVHTHYGRVHALRGVSLRVQEGEIVCLIGNNGAGKTTTLMSICGVRWPTSGSITLDGVPISGLSPDRVVAMGICQVPEGRRVFSSLSVTENLHMGAFLRGDRSAMQQDLQRVYTLFPKLRERGNQLASSLSGGEQQMLAIGRALMARPKLLLLDEPSLGLAPMLVETIFEVIKELNSQGATIFLVEQNAHMALSVSHRGYVMESGQIVLGGLSSDLLRNDKVREAYLGGS